jgi:hypothetical protein
MLRRYRAGGIDPLRERRSRTVLHYQNGGILIDATPRRRSKGSRIGEIAAAAWPQPPVENSPECRVWRRQAAAA